jgi:hypothetical protein
MGGPFVLSSMFMTTSSFEQHDQCFSPLESGNLVFITNQFKRLRRGGQSRGLLELVPAVLTSPMIGSEFPMPLNEETLERHGNPLTLSTHRMTALRGFDCDSNPW